MNPPDSTPTSDSRDQVSDDSEVLDISASVIALEKIDKTLFRADKHHLWKPLGSRAVFGGQVVGQALVAASTTVHADFKAHSLHCYFIRAGRTDTNILYSVDVLRDGGNFSVRTVRATQDGDVIFHLEASYHRQEDSQLIYQTDMPKVLPPEQLWTSNALLEQYYEMVTDEKHKDTIRKQLAVDVPIEVKPICPKIFFKQENSENALMQFWIKAKGKLGNDENVHRCVAAYLSDWGLLRAALAPYALSFRSKMIASLDHSMWFHSSFRADEWMLYQVECHRAIGCRALCHAKAWTSTGELALSVAQEGVIRGHMTSKL